jgi:hypothetical protein
MLLSLIPLKSNEGPDDPTLFRENGKRYPAEKLVESGHLGSAGFSM